MERAGHRDGRVRRHQGRCRRGRIILNDCPFSTKGQTFAAYADAPYGSLSRLGGLGPKGNVGFASAISHGGHFAGGNATVNNQSVGIYWTLP